MAHAKVNTVPSILKGEFLRLYQFSGPLSCVTALF